MDLACGYYHAKCGDQRVLENINQVFDTSQMRARPPQNLYPEELTLNIQEIVLENPNNVKEFLYNLRLSYLRSPELIQHLAAHDPDVIKSLCERGTVQNNQLDSLRRQF